MGRIRRRGRGRAAGAVGALLTFVLVATACIPLSAAPDVGSIELVSTTTDSGYRVEFYRNRAYPCSISGYQTFAIATRIGQANSTPAPLWTYLHGGAVGWFDEDGDAQPDEDYLREETRSELMYYGHQDGLLADVLADASQFRLLIPSMCNRDVYGGSDQVDANNPNLLAGGKGRTTNGLLATKAAIQYARYKFKTPKYFVHGGSAGSIGSYSVAWALQQMGSPPAGIVADSFVLNQAWIEAALGQGIPCSTAAPSLRGLHEAKARIHPDLANVANEPDKLVSSGRLTVPVAQVWNHGDPWGCGSTPMTCPLPGGSTVVMGSMDCQNEPLRRAIAARGPAGRSMSLGLCVDAGCRTHIVTWDDRVNSDRTAPADYNAALLSWVHARLADR